MTRIICIVSIGLLASAGVHAQQAGNPAGLSPDTPGMETASPDADHSNTQDKLFVRQAAIGNQAEVELGQLAQKKAASQPVRDFAKHMVDEHGKSGSQLRKIGRGANANLRRIWIPSIRPCARSWRRRRARISTSPTSAA
jgi:putative membrane protein